MGMLNSAGHYVHTMRGVLDGSSDPTEGPVDHPNPPREWNESDPDVITRRVNLFTRSMVAYVDESLAAGIGDTMHKAEQYLLETLRLYFHRCDVFNLKLKITKC